MTRNDGHLLRVAIVFSIVPEANLTLLKRTNQLWKLYAFIGSMAVGGGITLFQSLLPRIMEKEAILYFVIGGMLLVIGAFAWAYSAIRCPECSLKLLWYSLTKEGLGTWFTWLIHLEECPQCTKLNGLATSTRKRKRSSAKV